jgi:hypothetical protein
VEVANAPPEIVSQPPQQVVEGTFEYRLEVRDADGDDLSVSLAKAPEGMRLDADSGTLTWQVKPWTRGNFAVSVLVEDGHGGEASQAFALNLDYAEDDGALHE